LTASPQTPSNREIFTMAWPMAMRAVMIFSIVIIDASIGIAGVISGLALGITLAFSNAMQIKSAQAYGSEDPLELKTAFFAGLAINISLVVTGIVLIMLFGHSLLAMMAHSPQIAENASAYLNVFLLVLFAEAVSGALTSHFNGCGRTKLSFYSFLISAPVNICTSILLIFGLYGFPEMGIVGAAWGIKACFPFRDVLSRAWAFL